MQNKTTENRNFSIEIQKSADLPADHKANRLIVETPEGSLELNGNDKFVVETMKDLITAGGFFAGELRRNLAGVLPAEFERMINAEYSRIGLPPNFKLTPPEEMLSYEEAEAIRAEIVGISETVLNIEIAAAFRNRARCKYQAEVMVEENAGEFSEADKKKFKKGLAKAELKLMLLESEIAERAAARRETGESSESIVEQFPHIFGKEPLWNVGFDKAAENSERTVFGFNIPDPNNAGKYIFETNRHIQNALSEVQEKVFAVRSAERAELEKIAEYMIKNFSDIQEKIAAGTQLTGVAEYAVGFLKELKERRQKESVEAGKVEILGRAASMEGTVEINGFEMPREVFNWLEGLTADELQETKRAIDSQFLIENFNISPEDAAAAMEPAGEGLVAEADQIAKYIQETFPAWLKSEFPTAAPLSYVVIELLRKLTEPAFLAADCVSLDKINAGEFFVVKESEGGAEYAVYFCVRNENGKVEAGYINNNNPSSNSIQSFNAPHLLNVCRLRISPALVPNPTTPTEPENAPEGGKAAQVLTLTPEQRARKLGKSQMAFDLAQYEAENAPPAGFLPKTTFCDYCGNDLANYPAIYEAGENKYCSVGCKALGLNFDARTVVEDFSEAEPRRQYSDSTKEKFRSEIYNPPSADDSIFVEGGRAETAEEMETEEAEQNCSKCGVEVSGFGPEETPVCDPCERGEPFEKHQTEIDAEEEKERFGEDCRKVLAILPEIGGLSLEQIAGISELPQSRIEAALRFMITGAMSATNDFNNFFLVHFENGSYIKESHSARAERTKPAPTAAERGNVTAADVARIKGENKNAEGAE